MSWGTTQAPTETSKQGLEIAKDAFMVYMAETEGFFKDVESYERKLSAAGAPYTPGRRN